MISPRRALGSLAEGAESKPTQFRGAICLAILLSGLMIPSVAHAQDAATAEKLFQEARKLRDQGDWNAACLKFAESQRLDPSSGTLYNLAVCHLKQGKIATAWAEFVASERLARSQKRQNHEVAARRQADELESQLSYMTIQLAEMVPGVEIRRGDVHLEAGAVGTRMPLDPGEYEIVVSAAGYEPFRTRVTIGPQSDSKVVQVPKLKKLARGAALGMGPPIDGKGMNSGALTTQEMRSSNPAADRASGDYSYQGWRTASLVLGGVGGASLVTGGVFGVMALIKNEEIKDQCGNVNQCPLENYEKGQRLQNDRDRYKMVADLGIGIGIGLIAVGVATYVFLGSGVPASPGYRTLELAPSWGPRGGGLQVRGSF